jgi:hypothetical protein
MLEMKGSSHRQGMIVMLLGQREEVWNHWIETGPLMLTAKRNIDCCYEYSRYICSYMSKQIYCLGRIDMSFMKV